MAKPNSLFTRCRRRLAELLQPRPDPGEGWCINCTLNHGRTLVLPADGHPKHAWEHYRREGDRSHIHFSTMWPPSARPGGET